MLQHCGYLVNRVDAKRPAVYTNVKPTKWTTHHLRLRNRHSLFIFMATPLLSPLRIGDGANKVNREHPNGSLLSYARARTRAGAIQPVVGRKRWEAGETRVFSRWYGRLGGAHPRVRPNWGSHAEAVLKLGRI